MIANRMNPFLRNKQTEDDNGNDNTPMPTNDFFKNLDSALDLGEPPTPGDNKDDNPNPPPAPKPQEKKDDPKPNEDRPSFTKDSNTPPAKGQKPNKDDSIEILRTQRDEYKTKLEEITTKVGDPTLVTSLVDYVATIVDGPITKDKIETVIGQLKAKDDAIKALTEERDNHASKLRDINIRFSKEFQDQYEKPILDAQQDMLWSFATADSGKQGESLAPVATRKLFDKFFKEAHQLTPAQVQLALREYSAEFKKETGGEDYIMPPINSVMASIRGLTKLRTEAKVAYDTWESKKQEAARELQSKQAIQDEALSRQTRKERINLASKAYREFDHDSVAFMEEAEVEKLFNEEFDFGENLFKKEGKIPPYNELIQRGVKARLWDLHAAEFKEFLEAKQSKTSIVRGGDGGVRKTPKPSTTGGQSFLGDAQKYLTPVGPAAQPAQ